jgi:hypothetical protein
MIDIENSYLAQECRSQKIPVFSISGAADGVVRSGLRYFVLISYDSTCRMSVVA